MKALNLLLLAVPAVLGAQPRQPSARALQPSLFVLDLPGTALDEFPSSVKALSGVMTVVDKGGQHMLKASSPSEFLIMLPQALPADFTVELDVIPKAGGAPDDIMLEGMPSRNRGVASAELTWHTERISAVGGSPDMYQASMPDDLAASTPGNLTHIVVEFHGTQIKLYTNGRRLYTLDKQFARGRVLRVALGGADDGLNAAYLASFQIWLGGASASMIAGTPAIQSVAGGGQPSLPNGSTTYVPPVPGGNNPNQSQSSNGQTASNSQGLTGITPVTMTMAPKVTPGSPGPVVQWTAISNVTGYTVKRWKIDDLACCNNASAVQQAVSPWQDAALLLNGTYVYEVQATLNTGATVAEQTQYTVMMPIPNTPSVPAPLPTSGGTSSSTTSVASAPIAVQSGTPVRTASTPPPGSGASTALALMNGPAPTGLTVSGTPTTATVSWSPVTGATQYVVNRALQGSTAWTAVTATPIAATTSPVDVLPDFRQSYTYQVVAYQTNGATGAATVDYTPPKPTDPTGFAATFSGPTTLKLSWQAAPWAAEYLVSGPGIPLSTTVTGTAYTAPTPPYGTNVYQVASVFRPGGVLTPQSTWPTVTVSVSQPTQSLSGGVASPGTTSTSGTSGTCGCTKTGPFAAPQFKKITGAGLQGTFTHPTDGVFTVSAQSVYGRVMLDVKDDKNQSVLSADNPPAWGLSPDSRYFVVVATPQGAGAPVSVFKVARGPATWPQVISTTAYGDGQWGFSPEGLMFIVTRYENTPHQFSIDAFDLGSTTPSSGALHFQEIVFGPTVTVSSCGDRLMYSRWTQLSPQQGGASFYRRTSFGLTPVQSLWDNVVQTMSASITGTASAGFVVELQGSTVNGKTSFPSTQCSP